MTKYQRAARALEKIAEDHGDDNFISKVLKDGVKKIKSLDVKPQSVEKQELKQLSA